MGLIDPRGQPLRAPGSPETLDARPLPEQFAAALGEFARATRLNLVGEPARIEAELHELFRRAQEHEIADCNAELTANLFGVVFHVDGALHPREAMDPYKVVGFFSELVTRMMDGIGAFMEENERQIAAAKERIP